MLSEAAKNRALQRGPGFWGFWLAHHHGQDLDRCYQIWLGQRPIWFCARCSGLLPALIGTILVQLFWAPAVGWWDIFLLGVLPVPAFVDWARARWGIHVGCNGLRTATGAALGLSMGRSAGIHGQTAFNTWVLVQWAAMLLAWVFVELIARWRLSRKDP